jgi:undecaprenyl-diphosphatase
MHTSLFVSELRKIDYTIFWLINKDAHNSILDYFMSLWTKVDVTLGINTGLVFLVIMVGVIIWFTNREEFWPEFLLASGIIIMGGILVHYIKDAVGRMRPLSIFGDQVNAFSERLYRGSFPSGHTQVAFSVATFLSTRIKKYWWLFFLIAAFVGFERVYVGSHFPLDVGAAAVIGTGTTWIVLKLMESLSNK